MPQPKSIDLVERVKRLLDPSLTTTNPPTTTELPPLPSRGAQLIASARNRLAKQQAQVAYDKFVEQSGHQGEYLSNLYAESQLIPVAAIIDDPKFVNFRRTMDPIKLGELQESIQIEGLKLPIIVVCAPIPGYYHMRAGFRRLTVIRRLNWEHIAAIVRPADTPEAEEYWINIIENTAREKLTNYEMAEAARLMRDRFKVSPTEFAKKAGHSLEFVNKLLACVDRLPEEVLQVWSTGDRLPLSVLVTLSTLTPTEAIKNCRLWLGQHRLDVSEALKALQSRPNHKGRLWTVRGLERTQRLHMAIRTSKLPPPTKKLCLEIIEYLQGARKRVPGIVGDHPKRLDPEVDRSHESLERMLTNLDNELAAKEPSHDHIETNTNTNPTVSPESSG